MIACLRLFTALCLAALLAACASSPSSSLGELPRTPDASIEQLLDQAGVALDGRGNVAANVQDYRTSDPQIFACGDMRRGQSLVVWAIREGRQAARSVDEFLMGYSDLPR